jgi:phosphate transport system substrate-binding protein
MAGGPEFPALTGAGERAANDSGRHTELNLAVSSGVRVASIKNGAGEFIKPGPKSIAAAATASGSKMSNDFRVSLTNAQGKESYPIASFTWLYVHAVASDPDRGRAVAAYLKWIYTSGQQIAQEKGYAILPENLLERVAAKAATIH